jgi:hypothetical protein
MKIFRQNPNRTAQEIADNIKAKEFEISLTKGKRKIIESITYQGYDWLVINRTSLAELVEELLDGKYSVEITMSYCGKQDCYMHIEWNEKG